MSGFYDKLSRGAYKTNLKYPRILFRDPIFMKDTRNLTDEELASLPKRRLRHDAAIATHQELLSEYRDDQNHLLSEFKSDLEAHYQMVGHRRAGMLYAKAWEQGHVIGLPNVASIYKDLIDLVK